MYYMTVHIYKHIQKSTGIHHASICVYIQDVHVYIYMWAYATIYAIMICMYACVYV